MVKIIKYYLVDSENVNDNWLMLLELAKPDDEIIVFYTKKSPHMSYTSVVSLLQVNRPIKFEECYEGNNGLDFQLISYLGYLMATADLSSSEFIVMSNDTGFDCAVRFWKDRKFPVNRINVNYCKLQLQKQPEKNPSDSNKFISEDQTNVILLPDAQTQKTNKSSEKYNFDKDEVDLFISCIGKSNLTVIHETLVHVYGQKDGQNIYKIVKDKNYPLMNKNFDRQEKVSIYSDLIFKHSNIQKPENFNDFLEKNKTKAKNLNSMRASIVKTYGNEDGTKYYSLFKPYFKIISALK